VLACAVRGARGYSFEPVPSTFERLKANIELNNLTAIANARNIGLSDHPSTLKFTTGEDCTNHVIGPGEVTAEAVSVPVETLDASLAGTCPTLIKIDVEGFETPVLNGAAKTLDCPTLHSIVMELNGSGARYGYDDTALARLLREKGFVTYEYDPFERQLTDTQGRLPQSGNALFVRNLALVQAKLQTTPRVTVHGFDL
jgi:FkbM family methyltransferase